MKSAAQFCSFTVAGHWCGVDVLAVQEIIRPQPMTRVPLAHSSIRGIINLRGQIVTAVDLRTRLCLPERVADEAWMNVIVRTASGPLSLLADTIGDVIEPGEAVCEPPPETLRGEARQLIKGVFKLRDRLLLVLDLEETCRLSTEPTENLTHH